ncbi:MAG: muconolactone Delta-isomerase family protein [Candidatus Hodarchaeota archaeon]
MKFLVIAKSRGIPPPKNYLELVTAAKKWTESQKASGKIDCAYNFADGGGGVAIVDLESLEEMYELLMAYPLSSFFKWKTKPLVEIEWALTKSIEALKG